MKNNLKYVPFGDKYVIFSDGTILDTQRRKSISHCVSSNEKKPVTVYLNKKNYSLPRLIYEAFHNVNLSRQEHIKYKDNNRLNCSLENLEICTERKRKLEPDTVEKILQEYQKAAGKTTYKMLAKKYGVSDFTIWQVINNRYNMNAEERKKRNEKNKTGADTYSDGGRICTFGMPERYRKD